MDDVHLDVNNKVIAFDGHLGKTILSGLRKYRSNTFQIECISGEEETCDSVRVKSIRVALMMKRRGLKVGDIAMIVAVNHLDSCIPFIACQYIGVTPVCLMVGMTHSECKHLIGLSRPSLLFTDPEMVLVLESALSESSLKPEIVVFGEFDGCIPFTEFLQPSIDEESFICDEFGTTKTLSVAACSSGTTGYPKLVSTTHLASIQRLYLKISLSPRKNEKRGAQLIFSPLFWSSGFISVITSSVLGQCRIISREPFSIDVAIHAIEKYKPEAALLTPALVHAFVKKSNNRTFPSLLSVMLTGGPLDPETIDKLKLLLPNAKCLFEYGCTEIGAVSMNSGDVRGSVGKFHLWIDWKIVDVDTQEVLGPNQEGELCIKAVTMLKDYLNDPESTKAALDSDGYYKTGDLIYCDEEENLFVVDRIKEVMKYRNYHVATAELENLIGTIPGVFMVGVIGLPNKEDGALPMAIVERVPGSDVTEKQIVDLVENTLSDCKRLRGGVVFVDKLPVTYTGKIHRKALKSLI